MPPEIKTGDVIFIKGDTKISKWVKVAQYIIYGWKWLCFYLCRCKEQRPYNDPRFSHVLISMDKGMFIHAAGGKAVVYTTLDEYISKGLEYKVYRKDDFLEHSGIKDFSDLSDKYQAHIKREYNIDDLDSNPAIKQKIIDKLPLYAFGEKLLKIKFELGKNYATNALKRVWYWWSSKEKIKNKFLDDSYCSKFVADLLHSTNDIDFEPDEIIFPAYLELLLSNSAPWHEVTQEYKTIIYDEKCYFNVIDQAIDAKYDHDKIQANIDFKTDKVNLILDTIDKDIDKYFDKYINREIDNSTVMKVLKSAQSLLTRTLKVEGSFLESRWSDYKTAEKIKTTQNKLDAKKAQVL